MKPYGEPWRQREDWTSGWLESIEGGRGAVAFLWLFAVVWNAASWFATIQTLRGNATGDTELVPLFPAIGLGVIAFAIYVTIHQRRWGSARLELLTRPGVLGGPLRCVLHAPPGLARADELRVSVDCRGCEPGAGTIRAIKHLWHHEERIPRDRFEIGGETRVPIELRLPYALPESDPRSVDDDAVWSLTLHAEVPGADYRGRFALPVYRTPEGAPDEEGSRGDGPSLPAAVLAANPGSEWAPALPGSKIPVRPFGLGGREFAFGMFRNPWVGLLIGVWAVLFTGFCALIWYGDGPGFFAVVFVAATVFLYYAALDTLFGVTRVWAERGRIRVRHGPFGIGLARTLQLHEIERIRAVPQVKYGSTTYSQIRIERRAGPGRRGVFGRRVMAGTRVPSGEVDAIVRAMCAAVGL